MRQNINGKRAIGDFHWLIVDAVSTHREYLICLLPLNFDPLSAFAHEHSQANKSEEIGTLSADGHPRIAFPPDIFPWHVRVAQKKVGKKRNVQESVKATELQFDLARDFRISSISCHLKGGRISRFSETTTQVWQ